MKLPEHPEVARALATGYPNYPQSGMKCVVCECIIREEEPYYEITGEVYCPDCVERAKRYA